MNVDDIVRLRLEPGARATMLGIAREIAPLAIKVEDEDDHVLWWPKDQVILEASIHDTDGKYPRRAWASDDYAPEPESRHDLLKSELFRLQDRARERMLSSIGVPARRRA